MISLLHHISISVAAVCSSWMTFVEPATDSFTGNVAMSALWCLLIPGIMIGTKAMQGVLSDDKKFTLIKFASVDAGVIATQTFIGYHYYKPAQDYSIMSWVITGIFIVNILEASVTQALKVSLKNKSDRDNVLNGVNSAVGFIMCICLLIDLSKKRYSSIDYFSDGRMIYSCNYDIWLIWCYTFWNILFRIYYLNNTSTLLFTSLTLGFPIWGHYTGKGDWFQMRAMCLLYYIILVLGITPMKGRLLPFYNTDGYDKEIDDKSPIVTLQNNYTFRFLLLAGSLGTGGVMIYNALIG